MESAEKCILSDILGVGGPDDPRGDAERNVAMTLDERLERTLVPCKRLPDEILVGLSGRQQT